MQYRCRPRRTLLALVACASTAVPLGAVAQEAATGTEDVPSAVTGSLLSGLGLTLRQAPVETSGAVSYDLRVSAAPDEGKSIAHLVTASLNADTYIYQPWFATVAGTVRFTTGRYSERVTHTAESGIFEPGEQASRDRFLTGQARLSLFPKSRFPFEAHVERSDSRIDSGEASVLSYRSQSIGFSQRYRPASDSYTLAGSFARRDQWSLGARDTQHTLVGDFATRWKHHDVTLGGAWNEATRRMTDERSQFRTLVARHNYAPSGDLSLNTTVNWSQTSEEMLVSSTQQMVLQWSTVGLWRQGRSPLTLTGAVRGLAVRDELGDGRSLNSFGATLGANYELNKNARLAASGSISSVSADSADATSFSGSVNAGWQADPVEFKGLRYDWFANATAAANATSNSVAADLAERLAARQTQGSLAAQLGHSLARSIPIAQSNLVLSAAQTLAASANRSSPSQKDVRERSTTLQHTLGATWDVSGPDRRGYARGTYSDSAELGGGGARFQLLNFQLSGNFHVDRHQSVTGDLTWQRIDQRIAEPAEGNATGPERLESRSVGGEISYRHQRLFGYPRLRFTSRLRLAQDVLNQPGMLSTIPDRETKLWENRLEWSIGRLESQLVARLSEVEGKRRKLLMWRIQRTFGH